MVEEAIDDAGTVQNGRWMPMRSAFPEPFLQRLPVDGEVSLGNILEAMENLAIADAAVGAAQPQLSQVTGNDCAIGISPRGHDSTSDPGTSSAIALRSSVASLR